MKLIQNNSHFFQKSDIEALKKFKDELMNGYDKNKDRRIEIFEVIDSDTRNAALNSMSCIIHYRPFDSAYNRNDSWLCLKNENVES